MGNDGEVTARDGDDGGKEGSAGECDESAVNGGEAAPNAEGWKPEEEDKGGPVLAGEKPVVGKNDACEEPIAPGGAGPEPPAAAAAAGRSEMWRGLEETPPRPVPETPPPARCGDKGAVVAA